MAAFLVLVTHWEHCLEEIHVTLRQEAVSANALLMDIIVINACHSTGVYPMIWMDADHVTVTKVEPLTTTVTLTQDSVCAESTCLDGDVTKLSQASTSFLWTTTHMRPRTPSMDLVSQWYQGLIL